VVEHPESHLVRKTFVLRKMDLPPEIFMTKRSLLRWFALSFGLISEKESRSTVIEVLDVLFSSIISKKQNPSTFDLQQAFLEKTGKKISEKLMRYHLNRLIKLNLIYRKLNRYYVNNNPYAEAGNLKESFSYWIKNPINEAMVDLENVLEKIQEGYKK